MIDPEYVATLVVFGKLSAANLAQLNTDFIAMYAKIAAGNGQQIVSVAVPGQSIGYGVAMTMQDQFGALSRAIQIINGSITVVRRTSGRYL